jgi:hypothetical protein
MREVRLFLTLVIIAILCVSSIQAQQPDPRLYSGLRWRMIGPFRGGRVNAVSGVVGQPDTFLLRVGGWRRVEDIELRTYLDADFDATNVASIGAIGVAPSTRT